MCDLSHKSLMCGIKRKETIIQTVSGQLDWRQPASLDVVFAYFWHTVAYFQTASRLTHEYGKSKATVWQEPDKSEAID